MCLAGSPTISTSFVRASRSSSSLSRSARSRPAQYVITLDAASMRWCRRIIGNSGGGPAGSRWLRVRHNRFPTVIEGRPTPAPALRWPAARAAPPGAVSWRITPRRSATHASHLVGISSVSWMAAYARPTLSPRALSGSTHDPGPLRPQRPRLEIGDEVDRRLALLGVGERRYPDVEVPRTHRGDDRLEGSLRGICVRSTH